ncbi:hypothetical protein ACH4MU_29895 [Streptomyces albidoflavus]|uniref:Secreted protein n=1 Tax=Streptomyces wadayamensis TaxID=141454 RepID=A0ABR4S6X5_9ACTN|nr:MULTISPECIES: hypothetical protein [Streptomyces]MYQ74005.1 hypothetical protein [Streptomyces sp. SID4934]KDR60985.1 hypothetical protein DC60_02870 [Streptomyces wadayamensis]QXQ25860.1 hypothetical protein STALF2_14605 [Streptomyces albidoflavus]QXQ31789.1 hypothetical protein STALF4_14655 [Streptomyces albidoflavus]SCE34827.1 hypothetical protein GA0115237_1119123 [Streptomyces sp. ScaeMP-6W]
MKLTEWVPFAAAAATLLAALVAYAAARRTARTTWRSKTAEWQYASVVAFFDAAMHFHSLKEKPHAQEEGRGSDLDSAWLRLNLTGPGAVVEGAHPLYEAASKLFTNGCPLSAWNRLEQRVYEEFKDLSEEIARDEREGRESYNQGEYACFATAKQAYESLRKAVGSGSVDDWEKAKKAADSYTFQAVQDMPGRNSDKAWWTVTGSDITRALEVHGNPRDLHRAWLEEWERLDEAAKAFVPLVRGWLDGARPTRKSS